LARHNAPVASLAVLPDGRVVTGGLDHRVLIWNATTQGQDAQVACSVIGWQWARRALAKLLSLSFTKDRGSHSGQRQRQDNEPF
jgi:hypothetical protein